MSEHRAGLGEQHYIGLGGEMGNRICERLLDPEKFGALVPNRKGLKVTEHHVFKSLNEFVKILREVGASDSDIRCYATALFDAMRRRAAESPWIARMLALAEASWPAKLSIPANDDDR